jgi:porin
VFSEVGTMIIEGMQRLRRNAPGGRWPRAGRLVRKHGLPGMIVLLVSARWGLAQTREISSAGAHPVATLNRGFSVSAGDGLLDITSRRYLFGEWGGKRSALEERGVKFDFFYIADLQANPSGGLRHARAGWERIRGTVDIDFDQCAPWKGLRFHATGLWQTGVNLGAKIGTLANPSDLVSSHTTRLDSFWIEQQFAGDRFRVRAGQLAGLDFYGNQDYGGTWVMEPLGYAFGNLFSSVYESFNPAGTPGTELRFAPTKEYYIKTAVMAGNRDPFRDDPDGFHFAIRDAPDFLFETGYRIDPPPSPARGSSLPASSHLYPGDYRFGAVYNAGKFPDAAGRRISGNYLIYAMASQAFFRPDRGSPRGLDATFGFDWAPGEVSRENFQMTTGVRFNAPFAARQRDRVACGFVYSKISDPFQHQGIGLDAPALGSEKAIEVNYSLQVTPYYLLQPLFQYYVSPGANRALSNAPVWGFRTKVIF